MAVLVGKEGHDDVVIRGARVLDPAGPKPVEAEVPMGVA